MTIKDIEIDKIKPYENNPRINDNAVDTVAESIRQFGWKQPIVIDKDGVIIAGHTRYKAAQKLGCKTVPCVMADDLTEEQVRKYRLIDNKTTELSTWDFGKLDDELQGLDFDGFDLDWEVPDFDGDEFEKFFTEPPAPAKKPKKKVVEVVCPNCGERFDYELD